MKKNISIEKKYILLSGVCGFLGGFFSGSAGSSNILINMFIGASAGIIFAYLFKNFIK